MFTFEMSGDKRKQRSLDSYIITSKRKEIGSLANEQLYVDQPSHDDHEDSPTDGTRLRTLSDNLEALDADDVDPGCGDEMEGVVDSHRDTHDNDIGYQLSMKTCLTDDIKHRLLTNPFRPDQKYVFPDRRGKDGTIRRFMPHWPIEKRFLSYSPYVEGAFCAACCLFSPLGAKNKPGLFVAHSCTQFRHLKHFSVLVKAHLNSNDHRLATTRAANFIRTFEYPSSSIDYQIDRQRNEVVERNKSVALSVIKVIVTCARQNIALRGHRGESSLYFEDSTS